MHSFRFLFIVTFAFLFIGCHRIGNPSSKTPFGDETGVNGPFYKVANAFLLDLRVGRIKEAYARTSKDYQKEVNEDQFKAIMQRNTYPSGEGMSSTGSSDIKEMKSIEYHVEEKLSSGSIHFTFEVTKMGDEYRVNKFSLK